MIRAVIFDMFETLITHYKCSLYFGAQMAADAGISEKIFQELWRPTESDRSIGKIRTEEVVEMILKENGCYTDALLEKIVQKRISTKEECFKHLHPEIIPMLTKLKEEGISIGLISNCFSEEAEVIRKSMLFPYFDKVCLSYEEGVQKPGREIYRRCMVGLGVAPEECIYIGDGGSQELEAARELGMNAMQAVWYMDNKKKDFMQLEKPLDVLKWIR